jgi:hypothetical protein
VFVAGTNQTHTANPQTTMLAGGPEVIAAGATLQTGLAAPLPVLSFRAGLPYGPAPGAPAATTAADIDAAITALRAVVPVSPALEQELRPSAATLATWIDAPAPQALIDMARRLLFTANAFRLGLVSTVLLPGLNDHPHGAFAGGNALPTA